MKMNAVNFAGKRTSFSVRTGRILLAAALCLAALISCLFPVFGKRTETPVASAASSATLAVHSYEVEAEIKADRSIVFNERIDVEFLSSGLTMFFRSLPIDEGDRYFDVWAKCNGNDEFAWDVIKNPHNENFLDIECIGNADKGKRWTYELGYTVHTTSNEVKNGMLLDLIGSGWAVPLKDVSVTVYFPSALVSQTVYSAEYGSKENKYVDIVELSEDKKTLTMYADELPVLFNDSYDERMAAGITLKFELAEGVLQSYAASRMFTLPALLILLSGIALFAVSFIIVRFTKKKRELVVVVGLKAPHEMDPLKMGRLIDSSVDREDITSMIYWLAAKGYLTIDLSDEDDPVLSKTEKPFPADAPAHQRAIYNGLFRSDDVVSVSSLKYKFYEAADKATQLVTAKDIPHYEKRSMAGFILCGLLSVLLFMLPLLIAGFALVGGGYGYVFGALMAVPVLAVGVLLRLRNDRKFKHRKAGKLGSFFIVAILALIASVVYIGFLGNYLLTGFEKGIVCVFAWAILFLGSTAMSHTEKYARVLGEILGFKDFILYTEEDKIKFMLEENPELFYDILPYAQVLGVTDEWEGKFKNILLEPPVWCTNSADMTLFDYYILSRCLRSMSVVAMARPESKTGSFTGMSGGGGGFGGFSGGGHGGGGGGAR